MNTVFLLMAEYSAAIVPLESICEKYFGMSPTTAAKKAKAGLLPVPAFRGGESQKATWLVNLTDLAAYLDKKRAAAAADQVEAA
ncbi:pyocin activator PrtN family protein [Shewanella algae]|uniref:pyocin activator PrtN family protein n=1 Tax=Shewanella algae TaxID=38313 RepID=UPI001AADBC74|nr:pyocin activator PrtN family protein [Shewanella algae]MBO2658104.1 pyocin activator PrtN family protein [Shewanella algae]